MASASTSRAMLFMLAAWGGGSPTAHAAAVRGKRGQADGTLIPELQQASALERCSARGCLILSQCDPPARTSYSIALLCTL